MLGTRWACAGCVLGVYHVPGCAWEPQVQVNEETPDPPEAHNADPILHSGFHRSRPSTRPGGNEIWREGENIGVRARQEATVRLLSFLRQLTAPSVNSL